MTARILTPFETYEVSDDDVERPSLGAWIEAGLAGLATTIIPITICTTLGNKLLPIAAGGEIGAMVGFLASTALASVVMPSFFYWVSGNRYLITTGPSGKVVVFGPGLNPARFFQLPQANGNVDGGVMIVDFEERVSCKDDVSLIVEGQILVQVHPSHVAKYDNQRGDLNALEGAIRKRCKQWVSDNVAKLTSDYARENLTFVLTQMRNFFAGQENDFALQYGLHIAGLNMDSIDYTPEVQKVRDATEEKRALAKQIAFTLVGDRSQTVRIDGRTETLSGHDLVIYRMSLTGPEAISQDQYNLAARNALAASGQAKLEFSAIDLTGTLNGLDMNPAMAAALTGLVRALNNLTGKGGN